MIVARQDARRIAERSSGCRGLGGITTRKRDNYRGTAGVRRTIGKIVRPIVRLGGGTRGIDDHGSGHVSGRNRYTSEQHNRA